MTQDDSDSDDLEAQLEALETYAARTARGSLIRWCIRWALTVALFVYFVPGAPWLWWIFVPLVPLGLFNLVMIFRMSAISEEARAIREEPCE